MNDEIKDTAKLGSYPQESCKKYVDMLDAQGISCEIHPAVESSTWTSYTTYEIHVDKEDLETATEIVEDYRQILDEEISKSLVSRVLIDFVRIILGVFGALVIIVSLILIEYYQAWIALLVGISFMWFAWKGIKWSKSEPVAGGDATRWRS